MKNNINILMLALLFLSGAAYSTPDGFEKVRCGSDIPKALIGQIMPNERVVAIERRRKDLGLKDLGADEIAENLNTIYWMICGSRFILMEDHDLVRDAMPLPPSSDDIFEYTGRCQLNNTKIPEVVIAFFERKNGTNVLPARAAWKIDRKKGFVKLPTEGLRCE